jgi:hypothetical protein
MTTPWEQRASLYQGRRAVGGRITVSPRQLEFAPHVLDRKTGGRSVRMDLCSITVVGRTERSWRLSTFSPRRCLFVETVDGARATFLVNGLDGLVDRLHWAISESCAE